jgi:ATP-binding cassette subfamily B protein
MSQSHFPQDDEYRGRLDLALWRRIFAHARPYARPALVLATCGVLIAGVEASFPLVTAWLIDGAIAGAAPRRMIAPGAIYVALIASFALSVRIFIAAAGRVATGVAHDLRDKAFRRLQELPFAYFDARPVGWLVTRLTSDCAKISSIIPWFLLDLAWGTCTIVAIAIAMLIIHAKLALIVLAIVPPLAIVSAFFQQRLLESARCIRRTSSQITASVNEAIMGVRTTKALVREPENLAEFQILSSAMQGHAMRNALQSAVYLPLVLVVGSVGVGLALWQGGVLAARGNDLGTGAGLSLGSLIAFMQFAVLFSMPIQELARRFTDLQAAQAAAERVQSLLDTEPQIADAPEVRAAIESQRGRSRPGRAIDGGDERIETVEFDDVTFAYKNGPPVLERFDLAVRAGEVVALVGPTGGGKSTIVSLVARFYEPTGGAIRVNGVDYRTRSLHWLQSNLGVVLQTPHLFSGTVRENIRYGRLDATDAEVEAAARLVNAHEFILELDGGYGAEVGEGGARLSTGQRQLVSLARAVLADPQIFIMDEATSSVDTETEKLIQDAVEKVLAGRIAFVIAHRLSTIRAADRILVIDGGRIVEEGSHESLMARRGRYFALSSKEFAREQVAAAAG